MLQGIELIKAAVAEALNGQKCVSGWLGYGNVLFLGFGRESIPERDPNGRRSKPPYELQTSFSQWRVRWESTADLFSEREFAEKSINALIGKQVHNWNLVGSRLTVEFAGDWRLEVFLFTDQDSECEDHDGWWFVCPTLVT